MPKIDGDEYGPNSDEELIPGRWVNGEKLDDTANDKVEQLAEISATELAHEEQLAQQAGSDV